MFSRSSVNAECVCVYKRERPIENREEKINMRENIWRATYNAEECTIESGKYCVCFSVCVCVFTKLPMIALIQARVYPMLLLPVMCV